MSFTDGGTVDERFTPQDAFALLGNEYRAEIVRTLGDAQGTRGPRPTMSFSELYSMADVGIATSQFNYHLQKLVGRFVDKTDDGYRLRHEGVKLYRTILAGTYTGTASVDAFPVGVECYYCSAPIEAQFADRRFVVACPECRREYSNTTAPPSIVDGDRETLLNRMDQYVRHRILAFSRDVCSICANGLRTRILSGEALDIAGSDQLEAFVHRSCSHCGAQQYMSVGLSLLYDAALIAFFAAHDCDVTTTPIWELEFAMTDRYVEIRSTDPWEVALSIQQDDDELELVVDDSLTVLE